MGWGRGEGDSTKHLLYVDGMLPDYSSYHTTQLLLTWIYILRVVSNISRYFH